MYATDCFSICNRWHTFAFVHNRFLWRPALRCGSQALALQEVVEKSAAQAANRAGLAGEGVADLRVCAGAVCGFQPLDVLRQVGPALHQGGWAHLTPQVDRVQAGHVLVEQGQQCGHCMQHGDAGSSSTGSGGSGIPFQAKGGRKGSRSSMGASRSLERRFRLDSEGVR